MQAIANKRGRMQLLLSALTVTVQVTAAAAFFPFKVQSSASTATPGMCCWVGTTIGA
jgi:hypothetical protein